MEFKLVEEWKSLIKLHNFIITQKRIKITKPDWIKFREVLGISLDEF